jgi:ATP/maltotriose-dependent transcriptional regulator MalT
MSDALRRGRESFERSAWKEAHAALSAADQDRRLEAPDVERLAMAAWLLGREPESIELLARAHQDFVAGGEPARAARCAFWIGFTQLNNNDVAQASGWLGRARRLLDEHALDCVERGLLLLPLAIQRVSAGDYAGGHDVFGQAVAIGERFGERDLVIMARHGQGRALVALGRVAEGVALLDEVMVGVTTGDASAIITGTVYCSVLSVCAQIFDVRRAREWTAALTRWCAAQPDVVPFRGECLVRRAEVLRLQGAWPAAMEEAQRAREILSRAVGQPVVGAAFYQLAEGYRLRGDLANAEDAYRASGQWSRRPLPGLALLRLAQGHTDAAVAAIRRMLDETADPIMRAGCLGPGVEIMLAAGDTAAAQAAAAELADSARTLGAPFLHAVARRAAGEVLLAASDAQGALAALRESCATWLELDAPYEAARTRVLIGLACRQLADHDGAALELAAARQAFERLGAAPDVARVDALARRSETAAPGGLSAREIQVLRLIAAGKTNRAIAQALAISEKTVARHVSNIFTKLNLGSRSAATAYAYQHGFVQAT